MGETFIQDKLRDFTVIRNAIFKDYTLSAKAVGVACKLLSLPPNWDYSVKGLVALFSDGEASIRNALTELEEHGYLHRERAREAGKLGKCIYIITDDLKCEKPNVENPRVVNPLVENPPQLNTKELNTEVSNTKRYRFVPPTVEEVEDYINEKGYRVNARKFVDYYTSNGWRVGKNPMKDWRAAVRTWAHNGYDNKQSSGNPFADMLGGML